MADFVESAKNFMSAAVSRTSWEAQKQLRIHSKQSEIDKLSEQHQHLLEELGRVAIQLYQQNKLSDQQLSRLSASIMELDHDSENRARQLQEMKNEVYPAEQFAPAPTTNYAPPGSGSGSQMQACPTCGKPLRPNALYCRDCGTKLHAH